MAELQLNTATHPSRSSKHQNQTNQALSPRSFADAGAKQGSQAQRLSVLGIESQQSTYSNELQTYLNEGQTPNARALDN